MIGGDHWRQKRHRRELLRDRFLQQGRTCRWCGKRMRLPKSGEPHPLAADVATLDHLTPRSEGGPTTWLNCVASCWPCNNERGDMPADQWREIIAARSSCEVRAA